MSSDHEETDTDLGLDDLLRESRFRVIQMILAHPERMPSIVELGFWHEEASRAQIAGRLTGMRGAGIVTVYESDVDDQEFPTQYWTLTERAHDVLADANLLHAGNVLEDCYDRVNKPDEVLLAENTPRPTVE